MSKKIIVFVLTIVLTVAGSFYLKSRTVSTTFEEQYQNIKKVSFTMTFFNFGPFRANEFDIYQDIENIEELEQKSQVIARVHLVKRQQKYGTFYSTVKVLESFKGDLKSKEIVIYEPIEIQMEDLMISGAQKPMDDKQDYIVFLQTAIPEDNQHFNLINSCLGVIPAKSELHVKKVEDYKDYQDLDMIKLNDLDKYDFFDITFDLSSHSDIEEVPINHQVYDQTKQLLFDHYSQILEKYAHMKGKVVFES
ncbi:hypothetical protein [Candidatus Stoquefichus massiliensis]|uniref:hypothetical protein n=1 Tax=Candidatus Stoquefichus massiliensis TaxID=1470350 RepID=UPI000480AC95|nr:hypothetical protein [Candidatus Stoquefichus massiliensis]